MKYLSVVPAGVLTVVFAALFGLAPAGLAQCKPVEMKTYSFCVPEKWLLTKNPGSEEVSGCSRATGPCSGRGGFPSPGVFTFSFGPVAQTGDLSEAIIQADPNISSKTNRAELASGALTGQTEYVVSRSQLANKVWNEVYAISVGTRIFVARVRYNDEAGKIDGYRTAIFAFLASVSLRKN